MRFTLAKYVFASVIVNIFRIKKKAIYFVNVWSLYNDNTKALFEYCKKHYPYVKCYYEMHSKNKRMNYVSSYIVKPYSIRSYFLRASSMIVIDNDVGAFNFISDKKSFRKSIASLICKLHSNYCISCWHGTPLKLILLDQHKYNHSEFEMLSVTDEFCLGSRFIADILSMNIPNRVVTLTGSPRNDALFNDAKIMELKEQLKLPTNAKLVLYAPTFNNNANNDEHCYDNGIDNQIDTKGLCRALSLKFGGDWVMVARVHPGILKYGLSISNLKDGIVDGNVGNDMADYLLCSDALITDYSGSLFDYAMIDKPCFLYMPQHAKYKKDRGLYIDVEELPYSVAYTFDMLIHNISTYNQSSAMRRRNEFVVKLGYRENGDACKTIIEKAVKIIDGQ